MPRARSYLLLLLSVLALAIAVSLVVPPFVEGQNPNQTPTPFPVDRPGCLDHGCKRPFQKVIDFSFPDKTTAELSESFALPRDRRLVIEYVSTTVVVQMRGSIAVQLGTFAGGATVFHTVPLQAQLTWREQDGWDFGTEDAGHLMQYRKNHMAGQLVRLYADQGTVVTVRVQRSPDVTGAVYGAPTFDEVPAMQVMLSGYTEAP